MMNKEKQQPTNELVRYQENALNERKRQAAQSGKSEIFNT